MDTIYLSASALVLAVVLAAVWLDRWSVPVILVALGAGIVFGSDVLGWLPFNDTLMTNQIANLALIFILFTGGFNTQKRDFNAVALPAGGLATWGVVLTAITVFVVLYKGLGWQREQALLLSVIVSSTDAAAIFSILRRQSLPKKLSSTIEIESAANDPMAIMLTMLALSASMGAHSGWVNAIFEFIWKFTAGPVIGFLLAHVAIWAFNRLHPQDRGHYYVLSLGIVLLMYGLAEIVGASGMLSVFIAGYVMGNSTFVHKQGVANFFNALSTIANIGMFVLMGLLVFPKQWATLWVHGLILFAVLTFIGRPIAVLLGTIGMRLGWRNKTLIAWAGLRGSVPVILATYPMAQGMEGGREIFNLVFFTVLLSVLIQGSTLGVVARWLGLATPSRPRPLYSLELITMAESDLDLFVVDLPDPQGAHGPKIADLQLPPGAVITLITRGREPLVPKGSTELQGWDQVTVLAHAKDEAAIRAILLDRFEEPGSV